MMVQEGPMTPSDVQLPAVIEPPAVPAPTGAYIVPVLITAAGGDQAAWRYVEFFAANINNDHTRRAYARACSRFFAWCEDRGLTLTTIRPFDVGAWVKFSTTTRCSLSHLQRFRGSQQPFSSKPWKLGYAYLALTENQSL